MSTVRMRPGDLSAFLTRHIFYPLWVAKNRSKRLRYLAEFQQSQYWSREVLLDQQLGRFKTIVNHAFETCPFYRKKFTDAGIKPADIRSRDDISVVPTTSKEEIQEHQEEMISSDIP